ncbi:MAG: NAD(P)-binding protein [Planctomycetes bacterium]|nr:NAD(P)-binding protein [Planctomycetota bacterium]
MMLQIDYLIVGSGLTGAVIARALADAGREVLVVDRRSHMGGNVHDHTHSSGIRVHTYGPHFFRTTSDEIWEFVNRFSAFYKFEGFVKTLVDGQFENWPIAGSYIRRAIGASWQPEFQGTPANFEEASLTMMPRLIYEKFVRGYSEKQWGVPARELSAGLARRFDVRVDDEPRLMRHKHQGLPVNGYAELMPNMLTGIPVLLNFDYLQYRHAVTARRKLIFSGPIDEYYGFELGRLKYRGQKRKHEYHPDAVLLQPAPSVNNPAHDGGPHVRTIEWKHLMEPQFAERIRGTVLTRETPYTPDQPQHYEYPFPDQVNAELYQRYRTRADAEERLLVCGRLGEYRYYDMDQAIGRAMMLGERLLAE